MPDATGRAGGALRAFYLATPAFALLDLAAGWNVRVAALDGHDRLRWAYYAVVFACGLWIRAAPGLAAPVALAESALNILLLVAGLLLPYYALAGRIAEEGPTPDVSPFGIRQVLNFAISGTFACVAFYSNPLMRAPHAGGTRDSP